MDNYLEEIFKNNIDKNKGTKLYLERTSWLFVWNN